MEVAAGAVIDEEASVVGDFDVSVKSGQKRVVQGGEDVGLHLHVRQFLVRQSISIHHLQCEIGGVAVTEAAEEDAAEVAGAKVA